MSILRIAIFVFAFMEISNVFIMYFKPDFKYGNSMRAFVAFEESKKDEDLHRFIKYMTNWVANCKLIFIGIMVVIAIMGNMSLLRFAVSATIFSIVIYFFSLYPIIKKLDINGKIYPKGYSRTLTIMITSFILMFSIALIASFFVAA